MIAFTLLIEPVAKGRPRMGQGRVFTPMATRRFEHEFRLLSSPYLPRTPLTGPLELRLSFHLAKPKSVKREFPHVKPDIDNLIKSAVDSLNGFWIDDAQIVRLEAQKYYCGPGIRPRILVVIQPITGRGEGK